MSLRHALLALLGERPHTGYELTRRMRGTVSLFWTARHSQIYPELAAMEADGLVTHEATPGPGPREKKTYALTDTGRATLRAWLASPTERRSPKDELTLKAYAASSGAPAMLARNFRNEATQSRRQLEDLAVDRAQLEADPAHAEPSRPQFGWYLSLMRGITAQEAYRDWCDWVADRLERAVDTPGGGEQAQIDDGES